MSRQIELGDMVVLETQRTTDQAGTQFEAALVMDTDSKDRDSTAIDMHWSTTDESRLIPFAEGQRYRLILEKIDG